MFQIGFLHTGLLIFAVATVLPLIIWLIAKRKPPRVVFSSLRFIRLSKDQEKKRSKLKNILLLIIRMLIILLVTLAVARPQVYSQRLKQSTKHPPTAIAVVLDTSFSMDYLHDSRTLLDRAKEAVIKINALCTASDRITLVTLDEGWNALHAQIFAGSVPEDLVATLAVTHIPITIEAAVDLAREKLTETGLPNRELYLISDLRESGFPAKSDTPLHLIPLDQPENYANLSVSDVRPRPQLVDKSRYQSLDFSISNHGSADRNDVLVRAVLKNSKVAEKFVSIPAGQELRENILMEIREDGWQTGYIEVVDERLMQDNRAWFAFPYRLAPSVAVISQKPSLPVYLESALRVYTGAEGSLKTIHPAALSLSDVNRYQNFVIYAPGGDLSRIKYLLARLEEEGRGALVILDESMQPDVKAMWEAVFDCRISEYMRDAKTLSQLNPHHYISALLSGKDLAQKRVSSYWGCRAGGSVTLAAAGNDDLVLVKDRMVMFSFDPTAMNNSFFIGPVFPVLSYRALEFSGQALAGGSKAKLGDLLQAGSLTLPNGSTMELTERSFRAKEPGIYKLKTGDSDPLSIAVDPDPGQSKAQAVDPDTLRYIKPLTANWQDQLFRSRLGHDVWKALLLAALALFLLEMVIIRLSESRSGLSGKED